MNELKTARLEMVNTKGHNISFPFTYNKGRWEMTFSMLGHIDPDKEMLYISFTSPAGREYNFLIDHEDVAVSVFTASKKRIREYDGTDATLENDFRKTFGIVPKHLLNRLTFFREVFEER